MIYETAVVVRPDAGEESLAKVKSIISEVVTSAGGELLINDDWGVKTFAQATSNGEERGHYLYTMYKAEGNANTELERRYKISEDIMKFIVVRLGDEKKQEDIVKAYSNPNHKATEADSDDGRNKKFSHRKSCHFSENKTQPDWKRTETYSWLVNEFGKISPARVTGLRPKFQRMATTAIKRGRNLGLISHLSNRTAE